MKSIYLYSNYRTYLSDYYTTKKEENNKFSYRVFAKAVGFSSPVFLKLVMEDKKNLGKDSIPKIIKALKLSDDEGEYFSYLVFFNQAKNDIDRNYFWGLIISRRTGEYVHQIEESQFDYYNEWYTVIVREIIRDKNIEFSYSEIASKVSPQITAREAKKAVQTLLGTGLIKIVDGIYKQSSPLIKTNADVQSLAIRNFHAKMMDLGSLALRERGPHERNISSVTVKISSNGYKQICEKVQQFRDELMQIAAEDNDIDRVYQVNYQVFPVSEENI